MSHLCGYCYRFHRCEKSLAECYECYTFGYSEVCAVNTPGIGLSQPQQHAGPGPMTGLTIQGNAGMQQTWTQQQTSHPVVTNDHYPPSLPSPNGPQEAYAAAFANQLQHQQPVLRGPTQSLPSPRQRAPPLPLPLPTTMAQPTRPLPGTMPPPPRPAQRATAQPCNKASSSPPFVPGKQNAVYGPYDNTARQRPLPGVPVLRSQPYTVPNESLWTEREKGLGPGEQ